MRCHEAHAEVAAGNKAAQPRRAPGRLRRGHAGVGGERPRHAAGRAPSKQARRRDVAVWKEQAGRRPLRAGWQEGQGLWVGRRSQLGHRWLLLVFRVERQLPAAKARRVEGRPAPTGGVRLGAGCLAMQRGCPAPAPPHRQEGQHRCQGCEHVERAGGLERRGLNTAHAAKHG